MNGRDVSEVASSVTAMTTGTMEQHVDEHPTGLTDVEQEILTFERAWWKYAGAKETAIRETFGWSSIRHYQVLNALIDKPEALAHDPMLVRRLQRLRDARAQQRSARRLG